MGNGRTDTDAGTVRRVRSGEVELALVEVAAEVAAGTRAGGRPVLLVHGFTGAKEDFTELIAALAGAGWHAAAFDLRGHGASDNPPGADAYALDRFVDDVLAVADDLGWDRFSLVGHSMGGAIAQRLVLDHPDRVDALVLVGTFHGPLDIDAGLVELGVAVVDQGGMQALAAAYAARRRDDPEAVAARHRMEGVRPGYNAYADARLLACSPDMWRTLARRFRSWPDTLAEMASVRVPTLVLVGSEDDAMRAQCERLAATVPGARLVVVDGARHSPQVEAAGEVATAVLDFLGPG